MIRPIAILAIAGLAVSAVSLSIAASLDRAPFVAAWPAWDRGIMQDACTGGAEQQSRELAWDGDGSRLDIGVPAVAQVEPGVERKIHVEGPAAAVQHLAMQDGQLSFDGCLWNGSPGQLTIHVSGPSIRRFAVSGAGRLVLERIDQPDIDIAIAGAGSIAGKGHAGEAKIRIAGAGKAELGELAVERLTVRIAGSGRATVAPKDSADVRIAGSGDVRLATRPAHLTTRISGSGRIREAQSSSTTP
ncbi:MAG: DUF2807 domain-containing protein [Proteobacteria bacterium]|nr:DUF2807 domain-containing protein [Pseudomonadota bacterium]MBI3499015.1 DUF2807 domain-containing protein [Pseudomonadota bacterium]